MTLPELVNAFRQNHSLEHATIHVLSRRHPAVRMVGRSVHSGFILYGLLGTADVEDAAAEALQRLQAGEAHLAIHPRCGTNLVVTGLLAGLAAFLATVGRPRCRLERLPFALLAAALAAVAAQPVGQKVQEEVTTTPDLDGVRIVRVVRHVGRLGIVHQVLLGRG